jgi:uncharacterized protein
MIHLRNLLQPNLVLGGDVLNLSLETLQQQGIAGLILDVDDTLVSAYSRQLSGELHQWVETIRPHVKIWLVSNNLNQPRIAQIGEALQLPYLWGAGKPSRRKLRQAAREMDLPANRIAMVGDRLFTDVLAGNRLGMYTVMVEPMVNPGDPPRLHLLRTLEVRFFRLIGVLVG